MYKRFNGTIIRVGECEQFGKKKSKPIHAAAVAVWWYYNTVRILQYINNTKEK